VEDDGLRGDRVLGARADRALGFGKSCGFSRHQAEIVLSQRETFVLFAAAHNLHPDLDTHRDIRLRAAGLFGLAQAVFPALAARRRRRRGVFHRALEVDEVVGRLRHARLLRLARAALVILHRELGGVELAAARLLGGARRGSLLVETGRPRQILVELRAAELLALRPTPVVHVKALATRVLLRATRRLGARGVVERLARVLPLGGSLLVGDGLASHLLDVPRSL